MKFKFIMSRQADDVPHEGSPITEASLKIASEYMKEGYFRKIWIELEDGTMLYQSLTPVPNVAQDAMAEHE